MICVIKCAACGESTAPPGAVTASLTMTHTEWCQCCREPKRRDHHLWFCSPACLVRYVDEKADTIMRNAAAMRTEGTWPNRVVERNGVSHFESAVEE